MKRERFVIEGDLTINADAVRAAAGNAQKVQDIALEIPVVDPKDLSIDDQIFGIVLNPITTEKNKKVTPDTTKYTAVQAIVVDTLSGRAKPGFITINGTLDIPKDGGRVMKLEDCYFTKQEDAALVCRIITEVELDRALEKVAVEQANADFLQNQLNNDRF